MDISSFIASFNGWFILFVVFGISLAHAMFRGRQATINLLLGAYLGAFLYQHFPYLDKIVAELDGEKAKAIASLVVFAVLTFLSTWLFHRHMPREYEEGAFESIHIKIILAIVSTVVFASLAIYFLPLSSLANATAPLPDSLLADGYLFYWLLLPLAVLFFL